LQIFLPFSLNFFLFFEKGFHLIIEVMAFKKALHLSNGFWFITVKDQLVQFPLFFSHTSTIVHNQLQILFIFIGDPIARMIQRIGEGFGINEKDLPAPSEINDIAFGCEKAPAFVTWFIAMLDIEPFGIKTIFQKIGNDLLIIVNAHISQILSIISPEQFNGSAFGIKQSFHRKHLLAF